MKIKLTLVFIAFVALMGLIGFLLPLMLSSRDNSFVIGGILIILGIAYLICLSILHLFTKKSSSILEKEKK